MSDLSLLWGVKRKSDIGAVRSESDPNQTWTPYPLPLGSSQLLRCLAT